MWKRPSACFQRLIMTLPVWYGNWHSCNYYWQDYRIGKPPVNWQVCCSTVTHHVPAPTTARAIGHLVTREQLFRGIQLHGPQ